MDLIVFSHLRWNFVYQRPQHLISRFTKSFRVFYIEEPIPTEQQDSYVVELQNGVSVVKPCLNTSDTGDPITRQKEIIEALFGDEKVQDYWFWYYAPMAYKFTSHFKPAVTVYDCMDELSAFKFAPADLPDVERALLQQADVVFTGGRSLYEAKRHQHSNIHCFPSSIDKIHFNKARLDQKDPADQEEIAHPRLGFFGVIDERFDIELVHEMASKKPDWQFVFIGPIVKIDETILPKFSNTHYLGMKSYDELPQYIHKWDIAIMPFAINESTRFISPTKTPEYLAAGKPVVSSRIHDVEVPYGTLGLVHIADTADEFIECITIELQKTDRTEWLQQVDDFLTDMSWDHTWEAMRVQIKNVFQKSIQTIK